MRHKWSAIMTFALLMLCMSSYFIPSLKMENSENRTLATFRMVLHPETDSVVYHESPVERLEAALSDQFPFREAVVKEYLRVFNTSENLTYGVAKRFIKQQDNQYALHSVGNYELIGDTGYVTFHVGTNPLNDDFVQRRSEELEYIHANYPDIKLYVYYVTQAYDTSWFNDYLGTPAADYYQQIADAIPDYVRSSHLVYQNLDDYMNLHYKTDHHWNHRGAQRGYEDIYAMMSDDFDLGRMREPVNENTLSDTYDFVFLGSHGKGLGELYNGGYDEFCFYEYDLLKREGAIIDPDTLEEIPAAEIGLYDEYRRGEINKDIGTDHYKTMLGIARDKNGERYRDSEYPFIIRNSKGNNMNLLLTGDSYARGIRDVLASHFDTTVYLDYRTLSSVPIDYIIEKYDIDALLICSNTSMWGEEKYSFSFREDE